MRTILVGTNEDDPEYLRTLVTALGQTYDRVRTALSGSISTILTVLDWICVGIHGRGALPSPVLALDWPIWC